MDLRLILMLALGGLALLAVAARAFSAPLRLVKKAAVNMLLGFAALLALNATSSITGMSLGVNCFNAIVVGILGVPGLVLLLLLQWALA